MKTPPDSRWSAVRAAFEACAEAPAAARAGLLAAAHLSDAERDQVRELLKHHEADDAFLSQGAAAVLGLHAPAPTGAADPAEPDEPPTAAVGERLGAWEVVRVIGRGGMGEVYEARRADGQYQARAAVKLLKRGMDSAAVLRRFAQERQALAHLSHPHIARLLDAGASAAGLPYFVMEFVDGQPIHEVALAQPLERRLALFLQLADAVSHAHRHLLVHRDLKPGNVLVDAEGQVKLLDFGIAKALDPQEVVGNSMDSLGEIAATLAGERPYTPHYASPEQVRGEPVSTATDIYSLGVLLYQMLTGARPTGRQATTPREAARSVLEDEPTRPSRLSATEALDPQWLATRKRLDGDLDNILLKALEKQPVRRYASVDALAADVNAFLAGRPVSARPASAAYLAAKFVQRHRWPVLAAGLGLLGMAGGLAAALLQGRLAAAWGLVSLVGGGAIALVLAHRAALARDDSASRLRETKALLRSMVRRHADAITFLPGGPPAREAMLIEAAGNLERLLRAAPADDELAAMLAGTWARLAELQGPGAAVSVLKPDEAARNAQRALDLFARLGEHAALDPDVPVWHGRTHSLLGRLAQLRGDLAAARDAFEQGTQVLRQGLVRWPGHRVLRRGLAGRLGQMGQLHQTVGLPSLGEPERAMQLLDESARLYEALLAEDANVDDRMHLAQLEGSRAVVRQVQDRLHEAVGHMQRAVDQTAQLVQDSRGADSAMLHAHAVNLNNLSFLQGRLGDEAASLRSAEQAVRLCEQALVHDPGSASWRERRAVLAQGLAQSLAQCGRSEEALAWLRDIAPVWRQAAAAAASAPEATTAQRRLATNLAEQARCLGRQGHAEAAQACGDEALALLQARVQAQPLARELHLCLAEALEAVAEHSAHAPALRARATAAYAAADAIKPLQHDHLKAWQAVQAAADADALNKR